MAALDEVNAEGDAADGFLWRLQKEDGNATAVKAFGWDVAGSHGVIVNLTTWTSVEALAGFVFAGRHLEIMRQRRQWFHRAAEALTALWWVPAGHRPSTDEAEDRVRQLRSAGPTADTFTLRQPFAAPGQPGAQGEAGAQEEGAQTQPSDVLSSTGFDGHWELPLSGLPGQVVLRCWASNSTGEIGLVPPVEYEATYRLTAGLSGVTTVPEQPAQREIRVSIKPGT